MPPLWIRVDLGVMGMKGYSTFLKAPGLSSPSDDLVSYPGHSLGERSYSSAEMHLAYSSALAQWTVLPLFSCGVGAVVYNYHFLLSASDSSVTDMNSWFHLFIFHLLGYCFSICKEYCFKYYVPRI